VNEDEHDQSAATAYDQDLKLYKDTREKFKAMKMKTNLDLMQAFNETALRFIPLYHKRVEQQLMLARHNKNNVPLHL